MRVLITGANGFLSGHLVHELLRCGYTVRAMMRSGAKAPALAYLDIEVVYGNITDKSDIENAISGCDVVIHAAADTNQSRRHTKDYYPVNVEATAKIIEAVSKESCRRLIFVSTANTMGFGTLLHPGNESTPVSTVFLKSGYAKSKLQAQKLVIEAAKNKMIDAVVVNPTFMIGPMDHNPHSGRIFKMVLNKKIAICPPGGKNFVDVRDAARGIVSAIINGKSGECYLISGENLSFYDFFHKIILLSGQKTRLISIPKFLFILFSLLGSFFQYLGIRTELTYTNGRILCINNYFDNLKAVRELGLSCSGMNKTISDCLSWIRVGNI
ncbi:MAG: NAD-dependent epimerase/dehydratase family protein [Bacteroidales bacterium]|nr:NAD-dependent epimerase/dehydratase family protein [Bacteroidales bacterium]